MDDYQGGVDPDEWYGPGMGSYVPFACIYAAVACVFAVLLWITP